MLTEVIKKGVKDFYRPKYDPSLNQDGAGVIFKYGREPALRKNWCWLRDEWDEIAKKIMPKRHSRLGTKSEYVAFLGVLIKKLVEGGLSVAEAWARVCLDSKKLGHYKNSQYEIDDLQKTGSCECCGFFDLANTCKILAADDDDCIGGLWRAGGSYEDDSYDYPLANIERYVIPYSFRFMCVGWFVLSK